MRTLVVIAILGLVTSAAGAQTSPPPATAAAPTDGAGPQPGKAQADRRLQNKGASNTKNAADDALATCIAMWDRDTHMSRQEWHRACRRVANRLQNLKVK